MKCEGALSPRQAVYLLRSRRLLHSHTRVSQLSLLTLPQIRFLDYAGAHCSSLRFKICLRKLSSPPNYCSYEFRNLRCSLYRKSAEKSRLFRRLYRESIFLIFGVFRILKSISSLFQSPLPFW